MDTLKSTFTLLQTVRTWSIWLVSYKTLRHLSTYISYSDMKYIGILSHSGPVSEDLVLSLKGELMG